ncbi:hypothetical protein AQ808_26185 [Burkholderia pseudomallei]|nr:hypothetical protein AQ808_26185 [Burkholderia pseudomallei]OMZ08249.1 hypothetical protein AQ858_21345 [Burkholderia pseudomallei]OMZ18970.1 hypothetical protein AQ857_24880 [Burkholderia pseudomallei]OMZ62094.1 hypothetical protein AQ865_07515 [Burkholderia pseudomallei]ONC20121.1 hypothetical protein AQ912_13800 [Burkholderia pseudomallei]
MTMTLINVIVNRDDRRWTRSRIADAPRAGFERPAGGGRAVRTPSLGGETACACDPPKVVARGANAAVQAIFGGMRAIRASHGATSATAGMSGCVLPKRSALA